MRESGYLCYVGKWIRVVCGKVDTCVMWESGCVVFLGINCKYLWCF